MQGIFVAAGIAGTGIGGSRRCVTMPGAGWERYAPAVKFLYDLSLYSSYVRIIRIYQNTNHKRQIKHSGGEHTTEGKWAVIQKRRMRTAQTQV